MVLPKSNKPAVYYGSVDATEQHIEDAKIFRNIEIPDLERKGKVVTVNFSVRNDRLINYLTDGIIDRHQFAAGRKWQQHYERLAYGSLRSGAMKDYVSGRCPGDADAEGRLHAANELRRAAWELGRAGDRIVNKVLGRGKSLRAVTVDAWDCANAQCKAHTADLRHAMETLAEVFGETTRRVHTVDTSGFSCRATKRPNASKRAGPCPV